MKRAMSDFEKKVRHALIDKDMTAPELAKQLGITNAYLNDLLKNKRYGENMRAKIVEYLGIK